MINRRRETAIKRRKFCSSRFHPFCRATLFSYRICGTLWRGSSSITLINTGLKAFKTNQNMFLLTKLNKMINSPERWTKYTRRSHNSRTTNTIWQMSHARSSRIWACTSAFAQAGRFVGGARRARHSSRLFVDRNSKDNSTKTSVVRPYASSTLKCPVTTDFCFNYIYKYIHEIRNQAPAQRRIPRAVPPATPHQFA